MDLVFFEDELLAGVIAALILAAFVLSIIVFVVWGRSKEAKEHKHAFTFSGFFGFRSIRITRVVFTYLYCLIALEILALAIGLLILDFAVLDGTGSFVLNIFLIILIAAAAEAVVRLIAEHLLENVQVMENTTDIKEILLHHYAVEEERREEYASEVQEALDKGDSDEQALEQADVEETEEVLEEDSSEANSSGEAADNNGTWTCAVCGKEGNTGKFCPECGNPRFWNEDTDIDATDKYQSDILES